MSRATIIRAQLSPGDVVRLDTATSSSWAQVAEVLSRGRYVVDPVRLGAARIVVAGKPSRSRVGLTLAVTSLQGVR